jgi:hypothetical protein
MTPHPLDGLGAPRIGLSHDPCWGRYWRWDWERLPLRLPACTIDAAVSPRRESDVVIDVCLERNLPIVLRIDDDDGRVLLEVVPQPPLEAGQQPPITSRLELSADRLPGEIGFGFEWAFFVPLRWNQPTKPLGLLHTQGRSLAGSTVKLTISRSQGEATAL